MIIKDMELELSNNDLFIRKKCRSLLIGRFRNKAFNPSSRMKNKTTFLKELKARGIK